MLSDDKCIWNWYFSEYKKYFQVTSMLLVKELIEAKWRTYASVI